jgi:3-oxoacyl-[acyl-carrier protein] reductase
MRLAGKKAIITGGARGIGLAIAETFLTEGCRVYILDKDPTEKLALLAAGSESCSFIEADVAKESAVRAAINAIIEIESTVDILVNNAAINPEPKNLVQTEPDLWNRIIETNLNSVYLVSRAVIPHIKEHGVVINLASMLARRGTGNCAPYTASKGAIVALTRSMAKDYAPKIRVNAISPGAIDTGMFTEYLGRCANPQQERKRIADAIPLQRVGHAGDVAMAALFLASDEAGWITGINLVVDGGDSI